LDLGSQTRSHPHSSWFWVQGLRPAHILTAPGSGFRVSGPLTAPGSGFRVSGPLTSSQLLVLGSGSQARQHAELLVLLTGFTYL